MGEGGMREIGIPCAVAALMAALALPAAAQPAGTWTLKAPRPEITNEAAAVAIGGKLYAPGGSKQGKSMTRLDEYDPASDQWRARAALPQPLDHLGVAVVNTRLYAFGGFVATVHQGAADVALEYDPATDVWRRLASMKGPRSAVGAAVLNGRIHVIGGRLRDHELLATHEVYDPATGRWSEAAPLPLARDHLAVVAAEGKIHAIGGRLSTPDEPTARHDIYDPAADSWSAGPPLPTPRSAVAADLYKGLIVVVGGETRSKTFTENEAYDPKTGRWLTLAPIPQGRHGHGAAVVGNGLYFVGGALAPGGGGVTDQLIVFTLP
jgi:N-acetylneuraminic acid mutarotase